MKKTIYIIRHGQTDLNKQNIVQGRGVDSDLNATGRAQALAFFKAYEHVPFEKIYISALKRTFQSVKNFIDKGVPYEICSGLDELAWGIWEGQKVTPQSDRVFKKTLTAWLNGDLDKHFEGGESPNQVCARQKPVIEAIKNDPASQILVCMHGRAMRMFLCQLLNLPISSMDKFLHSNLTLYKLTFDGQHFELLDTNNTDHITYYFSKNDKK